VSVKARVSPFVDVLPEAACASDPFSTGVLVPFRCHSQVIRVESCGNQKSRYFQSVLLLDAAVVARRRTKALPPRMSSFEKLSLPYRGGEIAPFLLVGVGRNFPPVGYFS